MIDQARFSILVINVFAIAEQVFTRQCRLFLQTMAEETESPDLLLETDGLQSLANEQDGQQTLNTGYGALESLGENFSLAWSKTDKIFLQKSVIMLPPQLPNLIYKINGQALVAWVDYVAGLPEDNAFSRIHQYCQELLRPQEQDSDAASVLLQEQ